MDLQFTDGHRYAFQTETKIPWAILLQSLWQQMNHSLCITTWWQRIAMEDGRLCSLIHYSTHAAWIPCHASSFWAMLNLCCSSLEKLLFFSCPVTIYSLNILFSPISIYHSSKTYYYPNLGLSCHGPKWSLSLHTDWIDYCIHYAEWYLIFTRCFLLSLHII